MADTEFAKVHLREHLNTLLIDPISDGFWSIYSSSKELCERNGQMDQILRTFQNMLTRIPEWSDSTLTTEVERIVKVSKCTYIDDLLMGVFIAYMKSFASLHYRGSSSEIKIEFDRPSLSKFMHELYKHSARKLWQVAYLFKTLGVSSEVQARNRQEITKIISDCMEQVIRSFLPWEAIAKKYFGTEQNEQNLSDINSATSKGVTFGEDSEEEEEEEEEEEKEKPKLKFSDENETIQFEDLNEKKAEEEAEPKVEDDPLKEIESKLGDSLVLNL
jgi:Family of unknown function (DUF5764)